MCVCVCVCLSRKRRNGGEKERLWDKSGKRLRRRRMNKMRLKERVARLSNPLVFSETGANYIDVAVDTRPTLRAPK